MRANSSSATGGTEIRDCLRSMRICAVWMWGWAVGLLLVGGVKWLIT